jgi:hypothetical protein
MGGMEKVMKAARLEPGRAGCDDRLKFVQGFQYKRERSPVSKLSLTRAGSLDLGEPGQHGGREVAGSHGKAPVHVEHLHGAGLVSRLDKLNDP